MRDWLKDQFELLVAIFNASTRVKIVYFAMTVVPISLTVASDYIDAEDPQHPLDQLSRAVHHVAAQLFDWGALIAFVLFAGLLLEVFLRERRRLLYGESRLLRHH